MILSKILQAVLAGVLVVVGGRLLEFAELHGNDVAAFASGALLVGLVYVVAALRTLSKRLEVLEGRGTHNAGRDARPASAA